MSRPEQDTMTLQAGQPLAEEGLAWLAGIAERDGWPAALRFQLSLCLEEALANVQRHAFAGPAASQAPQLQLRCRRAGRAIALEIADNGPAFDPTAASLAPLAATLDEAQPGGHGLRLMRHYLSDMQYRREAGLNRLTLVSLESLPDAD
ncbi:ATP-binding protein [Orrella sp. JC864]|uniref:ATP-binding protein n=1 Tax=Orrella sp. JC864 TaxID=3120298 RepID=UPI00300AF426